MAMCPSMTHIRLTTEERLRRVHGALVLLAELHRLAAADEEGLSPDAAVGAANVASEAARDIEHVRSTMSATVLNRDACSSRVD
jgi:hypothetical protein